MNFLDFSAGKHPKKHEVPVVATNLNATYGLLHDETSYTCLGFDSSNGAHVDHKVICLALFYFMWILFWLLWERSD